MQIELENELNNNNSTKVDIDKINTVIKQASPFSVFKKNVENLFKLFGIFRKDKDVNDLEGKSPEEKVRYMKVSNGFDNYLRNDLWKLAVELINNGYTPSSKQEDKLTNILEEIVTKNPKEIVAISNVIKTLSPTLLASALVNNEGVIQDPQTYNNIINKCDIKDTISYFNHLLQNKTVSVINSLVVIYPNIGSIGGSKSNLQTIDNLHNNIINTKEFINANVNSLSAEDLMEYKATIVTIQDSFMSKIKSYSPTTNHKYYAENIQDVNLEFFDEFLNDFNKIIEKKFESGKDELINTARQLNSGKFLEDKIHTSVIEHILSVERELPQEAQAILKRINDKYYSLSKKDLDQELSHAVENLYENRLPEVLKKFMVIDKEYRIELTNIQGKNAEQLMLESLINIEEVLTTQIKSANEARLSDLSVTQRYTSAVKNKM